MHQVLSGLKFMHDNKLMHRDLKPGNLLISSEGIIKYSDFGLARYYDKEELKNKENDSALLTRNVCTRYYRPPEILYGSYDYSLSVDIWSAGCILGEIVLGDYLFKGENEIDQLNKIFSVVGNAVEDNWPGVGELPNYIEFQCENIGGLDTLFGDQTEEFKDLISKMLVLDPSKRISVDDALSHKYFTAEPAA
jgi:cyclin-dependent kinase 7